MEDKKDTVLREQIIKFNNYDVLRFLPTHSKFITSTEGNVTILKAVYEFNEAIFAPDININMRERVAKECEIQLLNQFTIKIIVTTKRNPDDAPNIEVAKRVCMCRANIKAYNFILRLIDKQRKLYFKDLEILAAAENKFNTCKKSEKRRLTNY